MSKGFGEKVGSAWRKSRRQKEKHLRRKKGEKAFIDVNVVLEQGAPAYLSYIHRHTETEKTKKQSQQGLVQDKRKMDETE
jgi:hypothetical protein